MYSYSAPIIVCQECKSFRIKKVSASVLMRLWVMLYCDAHELIGAYRCEACGHLFNVWNSEKYSRQNLIDKSRCSGCDQKTVELVEKNHKRKSYSNEILDLYRCANCGQEIGWIVKPDPGIMY